MWKWIGFAAVLAATLATRLYGASNESVWYDEAASVAILEESSLADFLAAGRDIDKLKVPLYFVIEYSWWHTIGASVIGLRWLSIGISLLTVAVLYWGSLRIWGAWTAIVASLIFALSKQFIFFGQEIRMYALMYLLALTSWFLLQAALNGKRWAWPLHTIMNLLLMQTHLLGICNLAAQFLFLLNREWRISKRLAAWSAVHFAVVLSVLPWVLNYKNFEHAIDWIPTPTVATLANTFFLVYTASTYENDYPLPVAPMWITALIAVPAAVFGLRAIYRSAEERHTMGLLLFWMLTPPTLMFIASYVYMPSYVDRYALYAAFPVFILIGRGIAAMPRPARYTLCALLVGLYAIGMAQIPRPIRPDFAAAVDHIRFKREPNDRIVTRGMGYDLCVKVYMQRVEENGVLQRKSMKRAVRDVQRGQHTWFVMDPVHSEFPRWWGPIEEAIASGTVKQENDKVVAGPRPVRVFLLKPA